MYIKYALWRMFFTIVQTYLIFGRLKQGRIKPKTFSWHSPTPPYRLLIPRRRAWRGNDVSLSRLRLERQAPRPRGGTRTAPRP